MLLAMLVATLVAMFGGHVGGHVSGHVGGHRLHKNSLISKGWKFNSSEHEHGRVENRLSIGESLLTSLSHVSSAYEFT